ncbi:unnamed protein product [Parascedosporium putredinis]|uniref:Kinesin-like protein n=1 Tax=Parascedosporium putredinis TaxID=1442378 RepID=A0A9P1HA68_9PEZI|nr:unnamed protein product [Parascedosporium putredinis]CAI8001789.1 unnamed protein product [Parascedosporium putredinis]
MAPGAGASSISVTVRVRPFTIREAAQLSRTDDSTVFLGDGSLAAAPKLHQRGLRSVIKVVDDRCLVFDPPEDNPVQKFSRSVVPMGKKVKDQVFAFDRIFDDNVSQTEVYEGTTKGLLDSVLDGYNATRRKGHRGVAVLLEIYNETIRDLLVPGGSKQGLILREDLNHAVTVAGLTSHHPKDVQEVMDMIVQGNEYRTVSPTEANATSSRSHAVLQINVAQRDRNADISEPHTMATLSIIDLAGSERASATKNRGERLMEGANINNKLTRLLKFSLGGNCKTVMIVCVSPSSAHFDETQNTLRYANRAKNIQTKVTRNVFNVNRHVKDFLVKIDEQMALINELKAQQKDAEKTFFAKFRKQNEKKDAAAREGVQRLRAAYENAQQQRQEKVASLKRLKAFERRISLLEAWLSSFDAVCESRGASEEDMPGSLRAIQKTANGILAELQTSRHHLHQKLESSNWERALDTALQHSIRLLSDGADGSADGSSQVAVLQREAEMLKTTFSKEMYREVLEQEKGADKGTMEVLLTAQLEIISSMSDTLSMSPADAVTHAKAIIHKMLESGVAAANYAVRPDSAPPKIELYAPSKRGTPKKKRPAARDVSAAEEQPPAFLGPPSSSTSINGISGIDLAAATQLPSPHQGLAQATESARRGAQAPHLHPEEKVPSKRSVRWRDDEEDGTLVEFQRTPQPYESTPEVDSPRQPAASRPSGTRLLAHRLPPTAPAGAAAPLAAPPLPPPAAALSHREPARRPPLPRRKPPPTEHTSSGGGNGGHHSSGSDSESPSNLDARKIASAMHSAKRHSVSARRLSSLSGSIAPSAAKRGVLTADHHHHRASSASATVRRSRSLPSLLMASPGTGAIAATAARARPSLAPRLKTAPLPPAPSPLARRAG